MSATTLRDSDSRMADFQAHREAQGPTNRFRTAQTERLALLHPLPPILILGTRSDIGKAVAHKFASLGHHVQLATRNTAALEADKTDMELRHRSAGILHEFDAPTTETHIACIQCSLNHTSKNRFPTSTSSALAITYKREACTLLFPVSYFWTC